MAQIGYLDKIRQMRESIRNQYRAQHKQALLADMRARIQHKHNINLIESHDNRLEQLLNQNPLDLSRICELICRDQSTMQETLKLNIKRIVQLAFLNLHLNESIIMLGNLCINTDFDIHQITLEMLVHLENDIKQNSNPDRLNLQLWLLCCIYEKSSNPQIIDMFQSSLSHIYQVVNFSNEFISMMCLLSKSRPVDESLMLELIRTKWNENQSERVLVSILQIIEQYLFTGTANQSFQTGLVELIHRCLGKKIKRSVKSLAIENIGNLISVYGEDIEQYILKHPITDELIYRAKIDSHQIKITCINVLCSFVIYGNQHQIEMLVSKNIIQIIVKSLQYQNPQTLFASLKAIMRLLNINLERFKNIMMNLGIEKYLDRLQLHANPNIYRYSEDVIQKFFKDLFHVD